jgi:hypothetical protein
MTGGLFVLEGGMVYLRTQHHLTQVSDSQRIETMFEYEGQALVMVTMMPKGSTTSAGALEVSRMTSLLDEPGGSQLRCLFG